MAAAALTDRYAANLHGVLSCYDRIIVTGTLPGACYAGGMTGFLYAHGIRIFDYPRFAEPLRDRIRQRAQEVCEAGGIEIEHVNKSHVRKEDLVARVLAARGDAPGLVHVLSAMESCPSYKPWLDKSNGHVFLRPDTGKCLHYYFYFIDEAFGLCYLRVPTWAPFGLQFYCNGHSALARSLEREGIEFVQEDNASLRIGDLARAQALADALNPETLHRRLKRYAHWLCPVADVFWQDDWHWSIRQAEYSTDLMFRAASILFIIAMAKVFTWLVAMQQTPAMLQSAITAMALPPWGLLLVMVGLLVIGCVMETTAALILLVPVLAPLTVHMGVDPMHFGVLMVVNLAIGMLTPPVGICLFVSCGIAGLSLGQVGRAIMPFVAAAVAALMVASYWPPLTTWLPSLIYR